MTELNNEISTELIAKKKNFVFIQNLASNLSMRLMQLNQFAEIALDRVIRRQSKVASDYLGEMKLVIEEMSIYLNDLQELAELEFQEKQFCIEEVNLNELFKVIKREFQPIANSRKSEFNFLGTFKDTYILADHQKLIKVIKILLNNAFRYIPSSRGKVNIEVKVNEEKKVAYIRISDNGSGIPEEKKASLFNPHEQNQFNPKGFLGFGLSICKQIMKHHQGDIELLDNPEVKGAFFELTLPIAEPVALF